MLGAIAARNLAYERDDSVLPFTFLISIFFHGILFFANFIMPAAKTELTNQWIYPDVTYRVFPGSNYFANYSRDEIFARNERGIAIPVSGNVKVEPERLRIEPDRVLPLRSEENREIESIPNRTFFGRQSDEIRIRNENLEDNSREYSSSNRASLLAPDAPDGILRSADNPDESRRTGISEENSLGRSSNGSIRGDRTNENMRGSRPSYSRGVIDIPDRTLSIPPTTPQSGRVFEHRVYTEPASAGPLVDPTAPEPARPGGEIESPAGHIENYSPRRIIFKPLPEYPEWAERERVQASPKFYVSVGADGRVGRVRLSESSGYPDLDRLAEASVRRWLYEPRPGKTEERKVVVNFVLRT